MKTQIKMEDIENDLRQLEVKRWRKKIKIRKGGQGS
jgi:hypothetical protein